MLSSRLFDSVDRICKAMKRNEEPFGGMQIVLSGDFSNCLPSRERAGKRTSSTHLILGGGWIFAFAILMSNFAKKDSSLEKLLNEMRKGTLSSASKNRLTEICEKSSSSSKPVFPTRLYTHNVDVDAENERELEKA